ncbi:unnamed protein product, partial [Mesorhabditis spiculigera]
WEERRAARRAGPRAPKDKENLPPRPPGLTRSNSYDRRANVAPRARVHRFCSTSSAPQIEDPRPAEELPRTAAELGLRPVLNPEPGRLGYRFDPVQKWKLVSEEWRRNPPVHEKKRLDLKWRVREYMLRQDEPQSPTPPQAHPTREGLVTSSVLGLMRNSTFFFVIAERPKRINMARDTLALFMTLEVIAEDYERRSIDQDEEYERLAANLASQRFSSVTSRKYVAQEYGSEIDTMYFRCPPPNADVVLMVRRHRCHPRKTGGRPYHDLDSNDVDHASSMGKPDPDGATNKRKEHRSHVKGGKVTKDHDRKKKLGTLTKEPQDINRARKGYTFKSAKRANQAVRRAADQSERKKHIPYVNRTPLIPPPIVVAVVGPSRVGKSLLIRGLVKNYIRGSISQIKGPVTIVTSKLRRVTFIEVKNDINHMIDVAKVADLVLLMVDASYGFEMEHFEFLNICQVHGMPRVLGVLNHLDAIPKLSKQKKVKKHLKHRFWTEVYQGCKLFYLSKLHHEKYLPTELRNLARFITVMKFRPMPWRDAHPYVLCDRFEDITDPETLRQAPKADRNICLYGYVRGAQLKDLSAVHIPGMGDMRITSITSMSDPCPFPDNLKKRGLNEK